MKVVGMSDEDPAAVRIAEPRTPLPFRRNARHVTGSGNSWEASS